MVSSLSDGPYRFSILYNVALVDTIFPRADDLQTKRVLYNWSTADDQVERNRRASKLKQEGPRKWIYPPHCAPVPPTDLKKLQEAQAWREEIAKKEKEQDPHYDDPLGHAEVEIIDPVKGVPIDKVNLRSCHSSNLH